MGNKDSMWEKQDNKKKSGKIANIILAVILATILWAYVIGEVNPETEKSVQNVPLTVYGEADLEEKGLVIISELPETVTVVVSGRRSEIYDVSQKKLAAKVDVSNLREGENQVEIEIAAPRSVDEAEAREEAIIITVDKICEEEHAIEIDFSGISEKGSSMEIVSMSEEKVTVSGPSTYVKQVKRVAGVIETESGTDSYIRTAGLTALDSQGNPVKEVELSVDSIKVEAKRILTKSVEVKTTFSGTAPEELTHYFDQKLTLKISGDADDVREVSVLNADPVNISNIKEDTEVQVSVAVPVGIEVLDNVGKTISKNSSGKVEIEAILRVKQMNQPDTEEDSDKEE